MAQSTQGVVLGTVKDASGAVVAGAIVKLTNSGEQTSREAKSNTAGDFEFQNVKPGSYDILVTQQGFRGFSLKGISVVARQTVRVDADLQVGDVAQAVEVSAAVGVIATDSPAVASTLTPERILGLPVNVRGGGSTSPYALIATLPGVQSDNGSGYSIQGAVPAQTESSSDGISITAVTGNSPNRALFPSIESIAEIKVQGVGNNAEYGTPGDVTTISKSGSNAYHGAGFWYHQNKAFDSRAFNQVTLPAKIGNTFGVSVGGPLQLPKIYNGKNRTFFFFTWESFRFPRQTTITNTVPTLAMKSGDFNAEGITLKDPFTGLPVAGNRIPSTQINAVAQKVIPFYPDPNVGILTRQVQANFVENRVANIESNQFDIRLDHQFNSKHVLFGRVTNSYDRRADRGDVYATRRHRFVNNFVYDLPFGKGRRYLTNSHRVADAVLGGWSMSSLIILQSGPFMTPTFSAGDPSGTNAPRRGTQRPDRLGAANGTLDNPNRSLWVDRTAFVCPGRIAGAANQYDCGSVGVAPGRDINPIGRFGNSGVGIVLGPGTFSWNTGVRKSFAITEKSRLQLEGTFTNVPNWTNLGDPIVNLIDNNFGRITGTRGSSDFGGNRTGQVSLRLEF